jgi:hypothetical protein
MCFPNGALQPSHCPYMRVPETPPNALGRGSRFWQMILEKSSDSAAVLKQLQDHLVSAIADCRKRRVRIADRVRNVTAIEFQNRVRCEGSGCPLPSESSRVTLRDTHIPA